jgi:PAS domain S-box-containing protein
MENPLENANKVLRKQIAKGRQENRESKIAAEAMVDSNVLKRAAAHLNEQALDEVSQGVVICDEEWRIIYANTSFSAMTGYSVPELINKSLSILQGADTDPLTILEIRKALSGKFQFEGEILNYRKDGSTFWNELSIAPIEGEFGGPLRFIGVLRDVTEKKSDAVDRHALAERLATTLDSITDGFFTLDRDWRFTYVNLEAERMLGQPQSGLLGCVIWETFPEAGGGVAQREYERALEEKVSVHFEEFHPSLGVYFEVRAFPSALGLAVTLRDVTGQKRAEAEQEESKDLFSGAFEHAPNGMALAMPDGRWFKVNRALCELVGYSEEEMLDKSFQSITHEEDRIADSEFVRRIIAGEGGVNEIEKRYIHRDGRILTVLLNVSVVTDGEGHARFFVAHIQDFTRRLAAEKELGSALERARIALKAGKAGTWELNLQTGGIYWDEQMLALYGNTAEDVASDVERWYQVIHPDDLERTKAIQERSMHDGTDSIDTEFRIFRWNDRQMRVIRAMGVVLRDQTGQPVRMTGINWDVTEERQHERELAEALAQEIGLRRAAQAGIHAKNEFLAVMSHEIRTPMNGILGFSELLAAVPDLPADAGDYVRTITSTGEALLRIIDDILDFSRLEAGGLNIEKSQVSPKEILNDIRNLLAPLASAKGLAFEVVTDTLATEPIWNDAGRLRQVLLNLAGNALKFTARGKVTIGVRSSGETVEFFVSDTGAGIPADDQAVIFEAFVQADSSISRRFGGTGLGLSISRHLVKLMGGELKLRSEVGTGSVFSVVLPTAVPEGVLTSRREAAAEVLGVTFAINHPLRILLVEDEPVNIKLMLIMLRKLGYDPLLAHDGGEAVEIFERERPDCLLMDLQMPRMDGLQATAAIRGIEFTDLRKAPAFISALTANVSEGNRRKCEEVGMNDYLNKPIKFAQLADTLRLAGEFHSALRAAKA